MSHPEASLRNAKGNLPSTAKQQKRLKIKTATQKGGKEVGEMPIGVPQHQDQAANMSNDSLEHTDPHYFNLNVNFCLSGNDSEGSGAADELRNAWTGQFGLSAR